MYQTMRAKMREMKAIAPTAIPKYSEVIWCGDATAAFIAEGVAVGRADMANNEVEE